MSEHSNTERTRTFTWEDPTIAAKKGRSMSGIEYLRAMQNGEVPPPPISALINMNVSEIEGGRVVFTVEPAEYN